MNREDYCSFEQSQRLKELGFDWECSHYYTGNYDVRLKESTQFSGEHYHVKDFYHNFNDDTKSHGQPCYPNCSAPTLSQAQKWLRDKKNILISIRPNDFINDSGNVEIHYVADIFGTSKGHLVLLHSEAGYENYEFALEDSINEALELLK